MTSSSTYQLDAEELTIQSEMDSYLDTHQSTLGQSKQGQILHMPHLAQQQYESTKKTKQITIRISERDLIGVKAKAMKLGIPYQTLIGSHIHQLAS